MRIQLRCRDGLKRQRITDTDTHTPDFTEHAGRDLEQRRVTVRDVRRRRHPRQAGIAPDHGPFPTLQRHDGELAGLLKPTPLVEQTGEFTAGQPVNVGHIPLADEGAELLLLHAGTFDAQAAERIRAVEHDEFHAGLGAGFHRQPHRADERVRPAAGVLQIVDHGIEPLDHLGRRLARRTVKRMHRQTGADIHAALDLVAGRHVTVDAVLRTEQSHERDARGAAQHLDRGLEAVVYSRRIGDEPDPFAGERLETAFGEDLVAQLHHRFGPARGNKNPEQHRQERDLHEWKRCAGKTAGPAVLRTFPPWVSPLAGAAQCGRKRAALRLRSRLSRGELCADIALISPA